MDVDVRMREEQLKTFDSFINASYTQIDKIFSSIGWTREYFVKEDSKMSYCPLNSQHRVPERNLEKHLSLCSWNRQGYDNYDIPLPENPVQNSSCVKTSITLDAALQTEILKEAKLLNPSLTVGDLESDERPVPQTSNRYIADFTPDERRVLYDYVVSKTTSDEGIKVEELHLFEDKKNDKPRPKSKLELLIEERDAKRRRISYRKKVHTNRKTQTEILREVIQNQMELLEQIIKGEEIDDKDSEKTFDNPKSKNGKNVHDGSFVRSHDNQVEKDEVDGMGERYERHYSRPSSHKRAEHLNKSEVYDSRKRHRDYSRNRNESNETKDYYSERTTRHFRERDASYEKRFPERHRMRGRDDMYYKRSRHDCGEDEYKRKHKTQSSYKNLEYNYSEVSYMENRKDTHMTESYLKPRNQSSGSNATRTSRDHYYAVTPEILNKVEHSNVSRESRNDDIHEAHKTYDECDDSHKKHKKKKKKKHHKHKSKKKHKKHKSSSSSSEDSNESS